MADYYAQPASINEATPSVILAMHVFGVDRHIRAAADRFASAGFATIVPDFYLGMNAPDGDTESDYRAFLPFAQQLFFENVEPRILNAAHELRARIPDTRIAIAGLCMGGVIALRRSHGHADLFSAAAVWYGAIGDTKPEQVDIPLVASYGAEDGGIPEAPIRTFAAQLRVPSDITIYPEAGHAFCDETRESFADFACRDSWRRTLGFLSVHLAKST